MTVPRNLPEPWGTIHREACDEEGWDWDDPAAEASLRAAMDLVGDLSLLDGEGEPQQR